MAMPVSKPERLVTNGKRSTVWQSAILKMLAPDEVSANLGMVSEDEAAPPAEALNAAVGVGAKLRLTVAVPVGGEFAPGFAVNCCHTPNWYASVSMASLLVVNTSQTAVAVPLTTVSSAA